MRQEAFERRHRPSWTELDVDLTVLERNPRHPGPEDLPARTRAVCQHLALAQHRMYSAALVDELNALAVRAHQVLYGNRRARLVEVIALLFVDFPRTVRAEWRLVLASGLLFFGPFFGMMAAIQADPGVVSLVLDPGSVAEAEAMYDPQGAIQTEDRTLGQDIGMWGFYIRNNTGIGFRTFASGLIAGAGSLFFLAYNGVIIGTVFGHLLHVGFARTLLGFTAGHGSFELTAIVLSGAAGFRLGWTLVAPGARARVHALQEEGRRILPLVAGFGVFFIIAAFIEAFWSSQRWVPYEVKVGVGGMLWVVVLLFLTLGGRARGPR